MNRYGGGKMAEQEETPTTTYKIFYSEDGNGGGDGAEAAVLKKGKWTADEDDKLRRAVEEYGVENWVAIEKYSGLARQSKSCRLRWINHLRPNLKKGPFTEKEERIIINLHFKYGNKWSRIASKVCKFISKSIFCGFHINFCGQMCHCRYLAGQTMK